MNDLQKERITHLRKNGISYSKIAAALGISINTIKSFCRRNNLGANLAITEPNSIIDQAFCRQCGKELEQIPERKPLKFCNGECRVKWWNAHPEMVNKRAFYSYLCPHCGKAFTAYGNSHRKYCSHSCYIANRFGGECHE